MGWRFQRRIRVFPWLRLNISKSGVSTSIGPRGADINIGPHGTSVNAGLPGTGISYRKKLSLDPHENHVLPEIVQDTEQDRHGMWLAVGLVIVLVAAGGGYLAGRSSSIPQTAPAMPAAYVPAMPATAAAPAAHSRSRSEGAQGADALAAAKAASGIVYVHRTNSDVRSEPSFQAKVLKKEPKGARVQLIAVSDKWSEIQDGPLKGWMRTSVLKETPPGERSKKKRSDGT